VEAPAGLRTRIEAERRAPRRMRRLRLLAGASAVAAAAALGLVVFGLGSSPERYHAALAGPHAEGRATFMRTASGWRIDLDGSGLPRLANGRYYEAWLRDPAGRRVAVGTFNEVRGVTLWAGVSPKVYRDLVVMREPAGGKPVLSGTLPRSS
jgi:Anti-sigma-K factor rskA